MRWIEQGRGGHLEEAPGERVEGEARREEEEGVEAVLGEEGVEGRGAEEAAQSPGDGGDGDERGERQAGEDALLEVRWEHVPRAAGGGVGGHGRGSVGGLVADHGAVFGGRKWRREKGEEEEEREGLVGWHVGPGRLDGTYRCQGKEKKIM